MTLKISQSINGRGPFYDYDYDLDIVFLVQEDEYEDRDQNRIFMLLRGIRSSEETGNVFSGEVDLINVFIAGPTEDNEREMGVLKAHYISYESMESQLPQPGVVDGGVS